MIKSQQWHIWLCWKAFIRAKEFLEMTGYFYDIQDDGVPVHGAEDMCSVSHSLQVHVSVGMALAHVLTIRHLQVKQ